MADQIVPLTNAPNQSLSVSLAIDGGVTTLGLEVSFNEIAQYWVMSIYDRAGNLLVDAVPLIASFYPAANLLQQQRYLQIGSAFLLNASGIPTEIPDSTNLGTDYVLLWSDTPSA